MPYDGHCWEYGLSHEKGEEVRGWNFMGGLYITCQERAFESKQ
jgi:hypothetical protein